jgi:hypothetical protein
MKYKDNFLNEISSFFRFSGHYTQRLKFGDGCACLARTNIYLQM